MGTTIMARVGCGRSDGIGRGSDGIGRSSDGIGSSGGIGRNSESRNGGLKARAA